MPEKRKSARIAAIEAAPQKKKVKYSDEYDSDIDVESLDSDDESDMDESTIDSVEPESEIEVDLEELARQREEAEQKAQVARQRIRKMLEDLPEDEIEAHGKLLDQAEAIYKPGARYSWDKLPAEIKNRIYHYTFVSEEPLKPHIWFPNVADKRRVQKYKLGAQFLRCSKEIYAQGKPILLGENTFEITNQFAACLTLGPKTAPIIRKVVVRADKMSRTVFHHVKKLTGIQKLDIVGARYHFWLGGIGGNAHQTTEDKWAKAFRHSGRWLKRLIPALPGIKVYWLAEEFEHRDIKSDGVHKDNIVALRFEVEYFRIRAAMEQSIATSSASGNASSSTSSNTSSSVSSSENGRDNIDNATSNNSGGVVTKIWTCENEYCSGSFLLTLLDKKHFWGKHTQMSYDYPRI